jgi:hypothetical protein
MSDNVIILGAGFSYDAGIPLLSNFIERMWEYSIREKAGDMPLSEDDIEILKTALDIKRDMDGYHGRVAFDDRNIEDILSMLVFNIMEGKNADRNKLKSFTSAISRTIELACNVTHPGVPTDSRGTFSAVTTGPNVYRDFWYALFKLNEAGKKIPTIISFNYDLVLERSLLQVLIRKFDRDRGALPFDSLSVDYKYKPFSPWQYDIQHATYSHGDPGTIIRRTDTPKGNNTEIALLKLHGSLNFYKSRDKRSAEHNSISDAVETPYILPPVSNKQSNGAGNVAWSEALKSLRIAKNVTFVGYSLPKTDMYMQFFLKAALGPNQELNKISVFDPELHKGSDAAKAMRERYQQIFSEQLRPRIDFNPGRNISPNIAGTTEHFVQSLNSEDQDIIF